MEDKIDLGSYYKFVYMCDCGNFYGSDEEEPEEHICPECIKKDK